MHPNFLGRKRSLKLACETDVRVNNRFLDYHQCHSSLFTIYLL